MKNRVNFYQGLTADYSTPAPIPPAVAQKLIEDAARFIALKEPTLPDIDSNYPLSQIEQENRDWWPTHCEALRQGRGDLLAGEYAENLTYFCSDGPFYGRSESTQREANWWAILSQPGVTMTWPLVMFKGEIVYFEWKCNDTNTGETIAKGNVTWVRRGHRGACYLKCEQLTFYRDVFAPAELMNLITREAA